MILNDIMENSLQSAGSFCFCGMLFLCKKNQENNSKKLIYLLFNIQINYGKRF